MSGKTGKEMRSLMIAVSITTLILVIAITAYFVIDVTVTTNHNIEDNKTKMIDQSVQLMREISANILEIDQNLVLMQYFDQKKMLDMMMGDTDAFYTMAVEMGITLYPIDYVSLIKDGQVVAYRSRPGIEVDPATMPIEAPEGDYVILDSLGEKEGFFVCLFYNADLSNLGFGKFQASLVVDRTQQAAEIEAYFNDQGNSLLLWMLIGAAIAIILSILLTTLGLRYFTRKYVVDPIERLNRTAEQIIDGTFEGEVEVDETSAYAALQGLLRSGQKVLKRMDEHIDD